MLAVLWTIHPASVVVIVFEQAGFNSPRYNLYLFWGQFVPSCVEYRFASYLLLERRTQIKHCLLPREFT